MRFADVHELEVSDVVPCMGQGLGEAVKQRQEADGDQAIYRLMNGKAFLGLIKITR